MNTTPPQRASPGTDWRAWHDDYGDPSAPLSRRLAIVRGHIGAWLDSRPDVAVTVVSACAGQGHDLLGVLCARPDAARVRATLLELAETNVAAARATAAEHGLSHVDVRCADAGDLASYVGIGPADLLLFAGVFGNIADADVASCIATLPALCAPGATVVWTRTRRAPDLTHAVRSWFTDAGFDEVDFDAPDGVLFSVGVHRLRAEPVPLTAAPMTAHRRLFTFVR